MVCNYTEVVNTLFGFLVVRTPQEGLEPTTNRLTADCSTTELLRNNFY